MKFEEKQVVLFKKIAKLVVLAGLFLWLLNEVATGLLYKADPWYSAFILIADCVAMIAILAFVGKMFLEKYENVLDVIFQLGLIGYVFFTAFAHIFLPGANYIATIVMSLITLALLTGLAIDAIKKRGMQFFDRFLLSVTILILGVFDLVVGHHSRNITIFVEDQLFGMTFIPVNIEFFLLMFMVVLVMLERYGNLDEKVHDVMTLLLWNLAFFAFAIGGTSWTGVIGIIADICVAAGAVVYIVMTYFKLKIMYGGEAPTTKTPE